MVFAKHVRAARRIAEQFEGRTVQKKYWAVVQGKVTPGQGTWRDQTRKIPEIAQAEVVERGHPEARIAVLHYRVMAHMNEASWLEIELETGRMHQIRVQAASRGHPVVGDSLYGSSVAFGPQTVDIRGRWIALHARSLRFRHPMTRDTVHQTAALPEPWLALELPEVSLGHG
jgi:23S rRNA-/tRNA-specific pseudouridylate synthase